MQLYFTRSSNEAQVKDDEENLSYIEKIKQDSGNAMSAAGVKEDPRSTRIEIPTECAEKAPAYGSILPIILMNPDFDDDAFASLDSPAAKRAKTAMSPNSKEIKALRLAQFRLPMEGSWLKIRNLISVSYESQMQCLFTRYSSWTLQPEDPELMRNLRERVKSRNLLTWAGGGSRPDKEFVDLATAVVLDENMDEDAEVYKSLREVNAYKGTKKFRCLVRCYDTWPRIRDRGGDASGIVVRPPSIHIHRFLITPCAFVTQKYIATSPSAF